MSATPDSTLANPEQLIADLRRQLAEREAELAEAREQQTAIAEVLQVINSSPGDLTRVFNAILEKAHSLCGVTYGSLQLYDGRRLHAVALRGFPAPVEQIIRGHYEPDPDSPLQELINGGRFARISDLAQYNK